MSTPLIQRKDLGTRALLWAVHDSEPGASMVHHFEALGFPRKVILAALRREVSHGYLDYGVVETRPWITSKGYAALDELLR